MASPAPTDREMEILKVLWELREGSVRDVHERLAPESGLHFNTIQTQLRIMDRKRLVAHRRTGRTFIYRPLCSREQVSSQFLHKVFNGASTSSCSACSAPSGPMPKNLRKSRDSSPMPGGEKRRPNERRENKMLGQSMLWIWLAHSAVLSGLALAIGTVAVLACRQPVYRLRLIQWVLIGCLVAPWLHSLSPWTPFSLRLLEARAEIATVADADRGNLPDRIRPRQNLAAARRSGKRSSAEQWRRSVMCLPLSQRQSGIPATRPA